VSPADVVRAALDRGLRAWPKEQLGEDAL
jgi:hypothetical protein